MYKIYELVNFNLPDNFDDFNNDTEIRQSFWALTPRSTPALGSDHELFEKFVNLCKKNGVNERVKNIYVKRGFLLEDDESQYDYDKYRLERKVANDVAEILPQKFPDISDNVYIGGGANGFAYAGSVMGREVVYERSREQVSDDVELENHDYRDSRRR